MVVVMIHRFSIKAGIAAVLSLVVALGLYNSRNELAKMFEDEVSHPSQGAPAVPGPAPVSGARVSTVTDCTGMSTGCPPRGDCVAGDRDVDVVLLKARRVIGPPFEAGLTHESIHAHTMYAPMPDGRVCAAVGRLGAESEPRGQAGQALASTGGTALPRSLRISFQNHQ
ncbi:hypothetical protein [Streptomyces sp. NPDC048243]|uniref:hypothetical protein n=1 Tax=Streptomyces sp. NPDC048243 TaxID=3365522 RepID=UPI0037245D26